MALRLFRVLARRIHGVGHLCTYYCVPFAPLAVAPTKSERVAFPCGPVPLASAADNADSKHGPPWCTTTQRDWQRNRARLAVIELDAPNLLFDWR